MTTADDIKTRAREIMARDLPDEYDPSLKDDEQLIVEGGVDSLGFISVLTQLEAEFDSHVPDEEWWNIKTLDALADAILRNQRS